jgi:hypothetical protein
MGKWSDRILGKDTPGGGAGGSSWSDRILGPDPNAKYRKDPNVQMMVDKEGNEIPVYTTKGKTNIAVPYMVAPC